MASASGAKSPNKVAATAYLILIEVVLGSWLLESMISQIVRLARNQISHLAEGLTVFISSHPCSLAYQRRFL